MSDFVFIHPNMLWLACLLPLYWLLAWWSSRAKIRAIKEYGDLKLFQTINPHLIASDKTSRMRPIITGLAMTLIILSMARPGGHPIYIEEEIGQKGLDIMLMLDLSSSMAATDLAPDRLSATQAAVKQFIEQIQHDRIGLTVFAGTAVLQSPLTQDYRTASMMVDILSTNFLPVDGTALGDALKFAVDKIDEERRQGAVIILLTDGENTKGTSPSEAIEYAKQAGVTVYTIGVGSATGAKIPDGQDENGQISYKTYRGETVITKLDEELLNQIASQTNGRYFSASSAKSLIEVYQRLSGMTKKEVAEKKKKPVYQEYYLWLLCPGLILLLWDLFLGRQSHWLFKRKKVVALPAG